MNNYHPLIYINGLVALGALVCIVTNVVTHDRALEISTRAIGMTALLATAVLSILNALFA